MTLAFLECGITIKRGTKAKEQVMNFLIDNEPHFTVEYGRTGKPKPYCYDQADSLIIARAGFECLKARPRWAPHTASNPLCRTSPTTKGNCKGIPSASA